MEDVVILSFVFENCAHSHYTPHLTKVTQVWSTGR